MPDSTISGQSTRLFIAAGQSNAVGVGDSALSVECIPGTAFEFHAPTRSLLPLADPVGYFTENEPFQPAITGSCWPAFAREYHALTGDSVVIVQAALGGTGCHRDAGPETFNWSPVGNLFPGAKWKGERAVEELGIPVSGILWCQGESDALAIDQNLITPADFKVAFKDLILRFRIVFGCEVPFYIIRNGRYLPEFDAVFDQIATLQAEVAAEDPFTHIVYEKTREFFELGWMLEDQIHYSQAGLNDIGLESARRVRETEEEAEPLGNECPEYYSYLDPFQFEVSPNPVRGKIRVKLKGIAEYPVTFQLIDPSGRQVHNWEFPPQKNQVAAFGLENETYQPGVYLLRVRVGEFEEVERVVLL